MTSREWSLSYEARDLYGADYNMTLDTAGRIKNEYSVDGIMGTSWEAHGQFMRDRFLRVYGDQYGFIDWSSEILLKYQEAMRHRQTLVGPEHFLNEEYPILDMTYLLPDDTMISREEAIEKAKEACGNQDYETQYSHSQVAVCMEADGKPVWKVTLTVREGDAAVARRRVRVRPAGRPHRGSAHHGHGSSKRLRGLAAVRYRGILAGKQASAQLLPRYRDPGTRARMAVARFLGEHGHCAGMVLGAPQRHGLQRGNRGRAV